MAKKNGTRKNGTRKKQRAIALAGGGPAAGLHIGVLAALEEAKNPVRRFLTVVRRCVGGHRVQHSPEDEKRKRSRALQTFDFFEKYCFRDDASYEWFPLNRGFAMDPFAMAQALAEFVCCPSLDG